MYSEKVLEHGSCLSLSGICNDLTVNPHLLGCHRIRVRYGKETYETISYI